MTTTPLQILNILGFIGVIITNYLANALPIAGRATGEVSDIYFNFFTPAGFTFAIWGIIYLLLLGFIVVQSRNLFNRAEGPEFVSRIGLWFFTSCMANIAWLLAWHHLQIEISVPIMLLIFGSLLNIHLKLGLRPEDTIQRWMVNLPFNVYLGWISVALVANIAALLTAYEWQGWGISPMNWTTIMFAAITAIALFMLFKRQNIPYALVAIWALYGIHRQHQVEYTASLATATLVAMIIIGAGILFQLYRQRQLES